jgi:hypothetical protein
MNAILTAIRDHLKKRPTHEFRVPATGMYLEFFAEWQDWSFLGAKAERLFLGYQEVIDGDIVFDPLLIFDWRNGELVDIHIRQFVLPQLRRCDPHFAHEFLENVYERHFRGIDA